MNNRHSPLRTLSIGGATFDLFVRTGQNLKRITDGVAALTLPLGEKIRVQDVLETCGGGASNTSVGLARLGCNAAFAGVIGSDEWGQKLLENFTKEGVDTSSLTIVEGETTSFSIILSVESGERVILYTPGTNAHLHDTTFHKERAAEVDWIFLNHLHENSEMMENDLLEILNGSARPGLTWNPGKEQLCRGMKTPEQKALLAKTDLLLLNREEALTFTGAASAEDALMLLRAAGVGVTCVTDGKNDTLACDREHMYRCPALAETHVVDTTGAGDAFGTGATWALLHGKNLQNALRSGTINAASVVSVIGAEGGLLTDIEMQHRLSSLQLDVEEIPFTTNGQLTMDN